MRSRLECESLNLGFALASEGKFTESEPIAREVFEFHQKQQGQGDDWQRYRAESLLGESLAGEKKYAEAEPLLLECYKGMLAWKDRVEAPNQYYLDRAQECVVRMYVAWGKPEKAAEWRKK
jgi:eukaryotic-like serine/threonine-protein kinase